MQVNTKNILSLAKMFLFVSSDISTHQKGLQRVIRISAIS